jgi:hypothetical protein
VTERWLSAWYAPAPALRLAIFRSLVGAFAFGYLMARFAGFTSVASLERWQFSPVGPVQLLSQPLPAALVTALVVLAMLLALTFAAGAFYRYTAPAFAALLLWVTSYRSSWGMLFHTDNLLVLHALLLALAPAADAWSFDARRARSVAHGGEHGRYGWALRAICVATVITYVVAGIAKLKLGGWGWLEGEQLRGQIAYDNLRKVELGRSASELGVWFVRHPALFPPLAALTLLVELGAPLALLHRRAALVWAIAAWGFHFGVAALMNIKFPYPLALLPFLAFFRLERWKDTRLGSALRRQWPLLGAVLVSGCAGPPLPPCVTDAPATVEADGPIIVLGDTQRTWWPEQVFSGREQNEQPRRDLIEAIARNERPAFVVHLGDMVVVGASRDEWRYFDHLLSPLRARNVPIRPLLCNHDYWGDDRVALRAATERFPELATRYYSDRHKNLGLIWLDSNLRGLRADLQERWLVATLAAFERDARVHGVLVFTHHPPFTNGVGRDPDPYVVEHVLPAFYGSTKTLAMFSGHVHGYERFEVEHKTFIVTGGGGGPRVAYETGAREPRAFNYVSIRVEADRLELVTKCLYDTGGCKNGELDCFSLPFVSAAHKNCSKKPTVAVAP